MAGPIPGSSIRIAPDRDSLIYRKEDPKQLTCEFACPNTPGQYSYRVTAFTHASGVIAKSADGNLAESKCSPITIPLNDLKPGAYKIRAELLQNNNVLDCTERTVGILGSAPESAAPADPKADWKRLTSGKSLIYIGMSKGGLTNPTERIEKVKCLIDEGTTLSNLVEYETTWANLEPMPGVYDWSELDEIVAYAGKKGMSVLLWPSFIGYEPDWIPQYFQKQKNGAVAGTKPYLFQGGRVNYWHSPELQKRIFDLVGAMALRYRGNPAVHGYYMIVEHGGDNPWCGYFPGYEPETIKEYRDYCREKFSSIKNLNDKWGTTLSAWNDISVPPSNASDRQRLDWSIFRSDRMSDFFISAVQRIRSIDPYKLKMVYTGAANGASAEKLQKLGCMLADGGAASPETGGAVTMGYAAQGLGRRTEEISVTQWAAAFPTQLDATLFNLTLAGGINANCKMFFRPGRPFSELRKPPYSLNRFELFIPIWRELAQTQHMPWQSYMLRDRNSGMLSAGATVFLRRPRTEPGGTDGHRKRRKDSLPANKSDIPGKTLDRSDRPLRPKWRHPRLLGKCRA